MKGKFSYNNFFLILLVFAFNGCERGKDAAVVEVDEEVIHLSVFKEQYQEYMDNNYQSDNLLTRYSFLNKLIDEKLMLKYAREHNLENDPSYVEAIEQIYDQMLLNYYFDKKINKDYQTTDLETRRLFIWKNQKAHIRHLFSRSEKQISNIYERLTFDKSNWSSLAQECFRDSILRLNGGDIGWQGFDDLDPIFAFNAFSLIPGEISEPVRTSDGYSIINLIDMKNNNLLTENDFQLKKEILSKTIKSFQQKQRLLEFTDSTTKSLDITLNNPVVLQLHQSIKSLPYDKIENLYREPLVRYMDQEWDVSESLKKMSSLSRRQLSKIITPIDLEQSIIGLITREKLLECAKKEKVFENELFDEAFSLKKDKTMINHVLNNIEKNKVDTGIDSTKKKYSHFKKELLSDSKIVIDSTIIKNFIL
ncbi:MAG: peptidylprolyl isomerase [Candidatus Neomarinimicrobiota bacterium]